MKSSEELPLLAQMNVEADAFAGKLQDNYERYCPRVPVLSVPPAMLATRGALITSHYKHHLQRAFIEPRYIDHLQKHLNWTTISQNQSCGNAFQ